MVEMKEVMPLKVFVPKFRIILGSFFEPKWHEGLRFSISVSTPKEFEHLPRAMVFVPPFSMVKDYKAGTISEIDYRKEFIRILEERKEFIRKFLMWLKELTQQTSIDTFCFLCWEKAGKFCHRQLVAEFLKRESIKAELH
jgi:hypothetical protein